MDYANRTRLDEIDTRGLKEPQPDGRRSDLATSIQDSYSHQTKREFHIVPAI